MIKKVINQIGTDLLIVIVDAVKSMMMMKKVSAGEEEVWGRGVEKDGPGPVMVTDNL